MVMVDTYLRYEIHKKIPQIIVLNWYFIYDFLASSFLVHVINAVYAISHPRAREKWKKIFATPPHYFVSHPTIVIVFL